VGWPVLSLGLGLLVLAGSGRSSVIGRWRVPGVGWLAAVSYSLYLSHKLAFHAVHEHLVPLLQVTGGLLFLTYALATLLAGAALHYAVERPFLRWRDRGLRASATSSQVVPLR